VHVSTLCVLCAAYKCVCTIWMYALCCSLRFVRVVQYACVCTMCALCCMHAHAWDMQDVALGEERGVAVCCGVLQCVVERRCSMVPCVYVM